jgi:tetratricopeptide (TPR) repeat protein
MLPGGILHAINYERLGQPRKKNSALLSTVLMFVFLFLLSLLSQLPHLFFLVINLAYAGYFFKSQDTLFQRHIEQGGKKGSLTAPIILSVLTTALVVGISFTYDYFKTLAYEKAVAMMTDGKYSEAENLFQSYKKYEPKEEATYYNLALIYQKTERPALARAELEALLRLNPADTDARSMMNELESNAKTAENFPEDRSDRRERLDDLLKQRDDFKLCDGVFALFSEQDNASGAPSGRSRGIASRGIHVERYEETERVVTLVWHASGLLGNGGFHYLVEGDFNGDPGFSFTAAAFKAVGADGACQAFQDVMQHFPGGRLPSDIKQRLILYDSIPEKERMRIDRLFRSDSATIQAKLAAYIRQHKDDIRRLLKKNAQEHRRGGAEKRAGSRVAKRFSLLNIH